jgi:cytochrome c553
MCHTVYPRLNRTGYEFRRHGYRFVTSPRSASPTSTVTQVTRREPVSRDEGQRVIDQMSCRTCHSIEGRGGTAGPSLDGVGMRRSADYISDQIVDPKQHNRASIMPAGRLSPDQLRSLVSFLTSLQGPQQESVKTREEPKVLDYLGASYSPAIRLSQSNGKVDVSYDTRELTLFAAGTLGPNFSMFVESNPATGQAAFSESWGEVQGVFNTSGPVDYAQVRGGQILVLQGSGFGATDRVFSDSIPLIYGSVNGFAAARFLRGASGEYSFGAGTTVKVFGGEGPDHSRGSGAILEQVIGSRGLSGFSVEFVDGWNPLLSNPGSPELRFRRTILAGNKTFQDARNRERLNLIAGVLIADDNHLVGGDTSNPNHSYGSYVELDAVPIPRHIGAYLRFDELRPTTQQSEAIHSGTAGITIDVTHFARLLLEYQRFQEVSESNLYSIGFRLNF